MRHDAPERREHLSEHPVRRLHVRRAVVHQLLEPRPDAPNVPGLELLPRRLVHADPAVEPRHLPEAIHAAHAEPRVVRQADGQILFFRICRIFPLLLLLQHRIRQQPPEPTRARALAQILELPPALLPALHPLAVLDPLPPLPRAHPAHRHVQRHRIQVKSPRRAQAVLLPHPGPVVRHVVAHDDFLPPVNPQRDQVPVDFVTFARQIRRAPPVPRHG